MPTPICRHLVWQLPSNIDCEFTSSPRRPLPVLRSRRQDPRLRVEPTPSFSVIYAGPPPSQATHGKSSGSRRSSDGGNGRALPEGACRSAAAARAQADTADATPVSGGGGAAGKSREMGVICVDVVCAYTRALVAEGLARRRGSWRVTADR